MTLEELYKIIEERKKKLPKDSYVTSLFRDGSDRIIQKVGEEAMEVVIAAKNNSKQEVIYEIADLWFHTLVLLSLFDIDPKLILGELSKRNRSNTKKNV